MSQQPVAAWYPDPESYSRLRWWDGVTWTQHVAADFPGPQTADGDVLAGWWRRFAQYMIDANLAQAALLPVLLPAMFSAQRRMEPEMRRLADRGIVDPVEFWRLYVDTMGTTLVLFTALGVVALGTYLVVSLRWKGRTVGMLALGMQLRTVDPGSRRLPWSVIATRVLVQLAGSLAAVVAYLSAGTSFTLFLVGTLVASLWNLADGLWPLWSPRNQTLHDKFAGTLLVRRR